MKLPNQLLTGVELNKFLQDAQIYSLKSIETHFSKYEPISLKDNWFTLLRCIDELINLPFEIKDDQLKEEFLSLSFNLMNDLELNHFKKVLKKIEKQFGSDVSMRLLNFAKMNFASTMAYETQGLNNFLPFDFSKVSSAILYYQSRRKYYVTILNLIDDWAIGEFKFKFIDTLNQFQYTIDACLQNITTNHYSLLLNNIIENYSIDFSKTPPEPSHNYYNLESFLLEPQVLTMIDQLEFRYDQTNKVTLIPLDENKIFAYSEIQNNLRLIEATFNKYNIQKDILFIELSFLVNQLKYFCVDDYYIKVPVEYFTQLVNPYIKVLKIFGEKSDYFYTSNFVSVFQKNDEIYVSTVVLFNRFITNLVHNHLAKNKSFQINSGFIFEDKISDILENNGFKLTNITRINRKEFDIITIKNNHIYNFQCKNNYIDIGRIQSEPLRIARLNNRLINYYKKALRKEISREHLIKDKLNISNITHFVISRFPVISEEEFIINFNEIEEKIKNYA